MPTDPNALIAKAVCIDCNIAKGIQLPVFISIVDKISRQKNCVNIIPEGATYSGLEYSIFNSDLPTTYYSITWGSNESQLFNTSGNPEVINNPGVGKISFFTTSLFSNGVLFTTIPNSIVTAKVCVV